jgi:protein-S-isoprenylcysteine O-methyltransferase Ste14
VIINLLPMSVIAIQHGAIAHTQCRRWWGRVLPKPVARSMFVLLASLVVVLLLWQWRPLPAMIWHIELVLGAAIASLVGLATPTQRGIRAGRL